ncbi:DUF4136 domain-containing protein [Salicola sp. Rm-C-2C1-2]|uniref:DUF4136 domain-containing protein n=1 Tax=Salicola sp. Rm-C-2C1-2 TaxID=3141321 RepID=UPI0032E41E17
MATLLKTATLALMLALVSGCARYAATDYDSSAGFDRYSTYQFAKRGGEDAVQGLDAARIERALEKALAGDGFTRADSDPDVLVRYRIEDEVRTESRGPSVGFGFGFGRSPFTFGMAHSPVQTREIREGQLVVEMVDPTIEQIVWEGRARRNLSESQDREDRTRLIDRVIEAMFEQYPPQP